jgi:hypothetical protein
MAFSLFTDVSPGDVTGTRCRLDHYSFLSHYFHCALEFVVIYPVLYLLRAFAFCLPLAIASDMCMFCSCMVRVKFTARPRTRVVSPKFSPMASGDAPEISVEQRETSPDQPTESLVGQQMVSSTEAALRHDAESGGSGGSETASDNSAHLKVSATAALAGIIYDFGPLTIMKARLASLEIPAIIF